MTLPTPIPHTITATELQAKSAQIIKRCVVGGEHLIVERAGLPVIVVLPLKDYHQLLAEAKAT